MHNFKLIAIFSSLFIAACSSDSDTSSSDSTAGGIGSTFPASFDNRVTSISFDYDKNGSIDRIERFGYDESGRIIQKTVEDAGGSIDTSTYLYFEDDLIEIQSESAVEKYGYESGRVVSYQYIYGANENDEEDTLFYYDGNGRLSGVFGNNSLYYGDDCDSSTSFEPTIVEPPELNIIYANSRIANINSEDGVFTSAYTYNSNNQLSEIEENYSCATPDITRLEYDSAGRILSLETTTEFYITTLEATYDNAGKVTRTVSTDGDIFSEPETITADYIYNEQDLIVSIDSTTVDPNPSFFISPSFIATIEYEAESCLTAVTVNPLKLATLTNFELNVRRNDALLCTFPLE